MILFMFWLGGYICWEGCLFENEYQRNHSIKEFWYSFLRYTIMELVVKDAVVTIEPKDPSRMNRSDHILLLIKVATGFNQIGESLLQNIEVINYG